MTNQKTKATEKQKKFWQHIHMALGLLGSMSPAEIVTLRAANDVPCAVDELARHAADNMKTEG